jgi:hypothetical protein
MPYIVADTFHRNVPSPPSGQGKKLNTEKGDMDIETGWLG